MPQLTRPKEPRVAGPSEWIHRVKACQILHFHCFSITAEYLTQHYHQQAGCSMPCVTPRSECLGCQQNKPQKEMAYLYGYAIERARTGFLEIPAGCWREFKKEIPEGKVLRGLKLRMERGRANNSPVVLSVVGVIQPNPEMPWPEPISVTQTLFPLWLKNGWDYHVDASASSVAFKSENP